MYRPIAIGLAPNLENDDIILAIKNIAFAGIFSRSNKPLEELKNWFKNTYNTRSVFLFNSGRSALFIAIKSLGIGEGDEVIVPSFTCVAVPNAVLWTGAKPIFADIQKDTLGIDPKDIEKKLSKKTKAIIIQHTFGIPAQLEKIVKIAKKNNIVVIEDCAHGIKIPYQNKYLGQFGDMTVFSFGRDKAISSVFGGALIINNYSLNQNVSKLYQTLQYPRVVWLLKQHLHSVVMSVVLPFYNLGLGKLILLLVQKLGLLTMPIYNEEKNGRQPSDFPKVLHPSLATLTLNQLAKLNRFNSHRAKLVNNYSQTIKCSFSNVRDIPLLRYPLLVKNRQQLLTDFKKQNIILGNWYSDVFDPATCPTAEYVAQHIINLPTYPTLTNEGAKNIALLVSKNSPL